MYCESHVLLDDLIREIGKKSIKHYEIQARLQMEAGAPSAARGLIQMINFNLQELTKIEKKKDQNGNLKEVYSKERMTFRNKISKELLS